MRYANLFNEYFDTLEDGVEEALPFNGKLYVRANANQITVLFKETNDPNTVFATIAIIPANTGRMVNVIFPTKDSKIKVTGGTAYIKLFKE